MQGSRQERARQPCIGPETYDCEPCSLHAGEAAGASVAAPPEAAQGPERAPPPDVHRALQALLAGRAAGGWVPALAAARSPAVPRTVDLLDLYSGLAATAGARRRLKTLTSAVAW